MKTEPFLNSRHAAKWLIGVISVCILIYLGVQNMNTVAAAVAWLFDLFQPLVIGAVLALILNVPMRAIEQFLRDRNLLTRGCRPLSIILTLVFVFGLFVGVAALVVPELINAVALIVQIAADALAQLAQIEETTDLSQLPFGNYLSQIDIDWLGLQTRLEEWFTSQRGAIVNHAVGTLGGIIGRVVSLFIGIVFAIYTLARKETLRRQVRRLVNAWLPQKFAAGLFHVAAVCSETFRLFIAGQATEAVILGVLCAIGMAILRIPYAPMIGALVGATALIPIVGAFVGTVVGAVMILTVDPFKALIFIIFLLSLQQVEGNLIYPKVVGSKIKLPAMWVLAAVTVGGNLAGPVGMFLGVPAASAAYTLLREATVRRERQRNGKKETRKAWDLEDA